MKISYNWLKDYILTDLGPQQVAACLTDCGLEVESLEKHETVKGGLAGVVIGEVMTAARHPNADKLTLTKVDVGGENLLSIVCGAPNVAAGQKVPVAMIGAVLHGRGEPLEIRQARIRGELSEGMICAEDELGLGESHAGIMVLDPAARVGMTAREFFGIEEDWVFEIGLTPNRSDAASHLGVARDLAAVLNAIAYIKQGANAPFVQAMRPSVEQFHIDNHDKPIRITIEDPVACPRYCGITVSGVKVGESPVWLRNRLKAVGLRPINNLVDISNYVLMETGQPLHFFDVSEIEGEHVIIKKLPKDTAFVTLDGQKRSLSGDDLMICNAEEGMCMAGVFGGLRSGVSEKTTSVFIESAYFDPKTIRKTSKYHDLKTEASFRFERGADPNIAIYTLKRAALLIKEIAGGEISSEIVDVYPDPIENHVVSLSFSNVDRLIGKKLDRQLIIHMLRWLEIEIPVQSEDGLVLSVPPFKVDVTREADVIEEILRIYGYNNVEIPLEVRSSLSYTPKPDPERLQEQVSEYLSHNGFSEIMCNSLTNSEYIAGGTVYLPENHVRILNPISRDLDVLRQTLLFGGLETILHNHNRRIPDLKLYEFGNIYKLLPENAAEGHPLNKYHEEKHLSLFMTGRNNPESWASSDDRADFYRLKAVLRNILLKMGIIPEKLEMATYHDDYISTGITYRSGDRILAVLGVLDNGLLRRFDIRQDVLYAEVCWDLLLALSATNLVQYGELPKYPEIRRDLALLLDVSVPYAALAEIAVKHGGKILKDVNLFDVYEGDQVEKGKKSYAVSFIFQDPARTLTDKEVDQQMQKLVKAFEEGLSARIR